jgi:hypothetical protein
MRVVMLLLSILCVACTAHEPTPMPDRVSVIEPIASTPHPTVTPRPTPTPIPPDTGWQIAARGIEIRELDVTHDGRRDRLMMARVDPTMWSFRVRYDPEAPRRATDWLDEPSIQMIINGGFFDPDHRVLGLLIADGAPFGRTYQDLGGLFGVSAGQVIVRSLILEPYQRGELFEQMVQSFPMLLNGDGAVYTLIRDNQRTAPRTVVGLDRSARVIFLVSPRSTFSLTDMATWLARSDLELDAALNLDGGTSSALLVRTANGVWGVNSWVQLPVVIEVK